MRKLYLLGLMLIAFGISSFSQNEKIRMIIGRISVATIKPGDKIKVPLQIENESGIKIMGMQLFVGYNHDLLSWDGTLANPVPGVTNFNKKMPNNAGEWVFNDNGSQIVSLWNEPSLTTGVDLKGKSIILEYVFTYKGGLKSSESSPLKWGDAYKEVGGSLIMGKTEIFDENLNSLEVDLINGELFY
jgi:hypothetical protein